MVPAKRVDFQDADVDVADSLGDGHPHPLALNFDGAIFGTSLNVKDEPSRLAADQVLATLDRRQLEFVRIGVMRLLTRTKLPEVAVVSGESHREILRRARSNLVVRAKLGQDGQVFQGRGVAGRLFAGGDVPQ